jgi:ubiquinone/menaquinone biosynthesis C-methylase UbiE
LTSNPLNLTRIVCPKCKSKLLYINGAAVCDKDHHFPVFENIVSFIENTEFDDHWEQHSVNGVPISKLKVAEQFLEPLSLNSRSSQVILDVGCGDGVHADYFNSDKFKGMELTYIGMDISLQALESARKRSGNGVFLHADAGNIPLESESVDAVFSYGVIAYTDSPKESLAELARVVKKGGLVGIWVYPDPGGVKGALFKSVRTISNLLGSFLTARLADLIVPFLGVLPVASGVNLRNATWEQCREVVLVNIGPSKLSLPTIPTIKDWVESDNLTIIEENVEPSITLWARKK